MEAVAEVKKAVFAFEGSKGVKRRNVDPLGIEALLPRVTFNDSALTELILWDRYLGSSGAMSLARALNGNTYVKKLVLRGNEVNDAGAKSLADVLRDSQQIRTFHFKNQNHYSDFSPLGAMLEHNTNMVDVAFCGNVKALGNYSRGVVSLSVRIRSPCIFCSQAD
jgi:hypothetical protein